MKGGRVSVGYQSPLVLQAPSVVFHGALCEGWTESIPAVS